MILFKIILSVLACLYISGCIFIYVLMDKSEQSRRELPSTSTTTNFLDLSQVEPEIESSSYEFLDSTLAYHVLTALDTYKPANKSASKDEEAYLGLKRDNAYCDKHRAYFVENTQSLFDKINIIHDWEKGTFVTGIIDSIANDLHTKNTRRMNKEKRAIQTHDVMPSATFFFTSPSLSYYLDHNTQFSCLTQESNHIPGSNKLALKHLVAQGIETYVEKYENRPHCLAYDKFFPKTWLLYERAECKEFFDKLNSPEYQALKEQKNIVYIKKISNTHRGKGVHPLHQEEEDKLREEYKNGALCGKVKARVLMQHYIDNPLLVNGHKFDFRMYLVVASANPVIAYYHDGFLRVSLAEYDVNSTDKKVLLTNLALNKQIYDDAQNGTLYEGMDQEALKNAQQWSMQRLQDYLLEANVIKDANWLDNYLRPEFKKAMIHLVRLSADNFLNHSSFYGLYGVDFMLDMNLNLWFIEANSGPSFEGYSQPMGKFISKMLLDHFEIVYGLLKSRMKRMVSFVNKLVKERQVIEMEDGEIIVMNLERNKEIFGEITKNYFEKEYEVSHDNGFAKIIDDNYEGTRAYQGLISEECI